MTLLDFINAHVDSLGGYVLTIIVVAVFITANRIINRSPPP